MKVEMEYMSIYIPRLTASPVKASPRFGGLIQRGISFSFKNSPFEGGSLTKSAGDVVSV
jgi:hypothetical protein